VTRRISLGCALLAILLGACQQTLVLDDLSPDGGRGGTGGSGVGPIDASASDAHCSTSQPLPITFTADVPQVIVVLDRSSMTTEMPFGPQDTEFTAAAADLSAEVSSYQVSSGQGRDAKPPIGFSYLDFPNSTSDCNAAVGCCASDVTSTPNSQAFQNAAYACGAPDVCVPSNNRPIAAALTAAYSAFNQTSGAQTGQRFVLLVTGGPPSGQCMSLGDCQSAINEVDSLIKKLDVTTYIVGMGDQTNDSCLQAMANDEGSAQFYSAAITPNDLVGALETITSDIAEAACHLTLSTAVSSSGQLTVQFQGALVAQEFRNGWSLDNGGGAPRLTLHGNACQNFIENYPFGLQILSSSCVSDHFPSP
jgi:von Willebrand factor type A domain